ncbi:MAG: M20 family metallopeptidase [Thermoguttaceae bacterium]
MPIDTVEILCELVAIPSVNPMGRHDLTSVGEARLTEYLTARLTALGLFVQRQTIAPMRENLLARLDGDTRPECGGGLILLDAHQDTVPADNMTIEPWSPTVREGRLYGRGACDVKGGMAAIIAAVARLAAERPAGMPTILLSCPIDEEYHLSGVRALTAAWHEGKEPAAPRLPDAAIVAEPTGLDVIVAHKGIIRWFCHTRGRAAHSSEPARGDNAVFKMAQVVTAIERYAREVLAMRPGHALCGPYTLNVGTIQGGTSVNIVPERCTIEIEIRVPPGGDPQRARNELIEYLAGETDSPASPGGEASLMHEAPYMEGPALSDEINPALAERLTSTVREITGGCRRRGVSYGTHAAFYSNLGIPAVVFGPGAIEQAHTADEWISLDQLQQAGEILYRFIKTWRPL